MRVKELDAAVAQQRSAVAQQKAADDQAMANKEAEMLRERQRLLDEVHEEARANVCKLHAEAAAAHLAEDSNFIPRPTSYESSLPEP